MVNIQPSAVKESINLHAAHVASRRLHPIPLRLVQKDINHFHAAQSIQLMQRHFTFQNFGNGNGLVYGVPWRNSIGEPSLLSVCANRVWVRRQNHQVSRLEVEISIKLTRPFCGRLA
jgi:hypothetical protein